MLWALPGPNALSDTVTEADTMPAEMPTEIIQECLETYCQSFSNQPCLLFSNIDLQEWASSKRPPDIVAYPMLALVLRTSKHPWLGEEPRKRRITDDMSRRAWGLLTSAYSAFNFDEAYYQGLCILSQADFAGKIAVKYASNNRADRPSQPAMFREHRFR